jgi:hypothetical protein
MLLFFTASRPAVVCVGGLYREIKWSERETCNSPASGAKVNTTIPTYYVFMAW